MIQEEIARLTGKLVFQVDNRPLMAFEKRLNSVIAQLRQLETLANKKFNIKVQLDSRTLREQLAKASGAKVTLKDVHVSPEALALAAKRISDRLETTPITLDKIRVDISSLIEQKKLVRTLLGQMQVNLPIKFATTNMEAELRKGLRDIEARNPLKLRAGIDDARFIADVRRSLRAASARIGAMKIKIQDPQLRLAVDRNHLQTQIRQIVSDIEYQVRLRLRMDNGPRPPGGGGGGGGGSGGSGRRSFAGGLAGAAMGFGRGALPGLGAAFAISAVNDINQQLIATSTALQAVSGSAEGYASNMKFLEELTQEQGRNMRDVSPQFTSVLASAKASIGNQGTQDLFRGLTKYGTVMGLDAEAMKGSMRAISQMFSKDKIQAEEAQGQLAERLPAAMQLLAEANGTDVPGLREQMQKGKLDPKKVLPEMARIMEKLAEENGAYAKALESTRVAQGRMNRQFERSVRIFADGGFDKGIRSFFQTMADGMQKGAPLIKALGAAFDFLIRPINALVLIGGKLGEQWDNIAKVFGLTGDQLAILATVAGIAALPFGALAIAIAGVALAVEDVMMYMAGGDSMFGRMADDVPGFSAALKEFGTEAKQFGEYLQLAVTNAIELVGALKGLSFPQMFIDTMRELSAILKLFNAAVDRLATAGQYAQMMAPEGGVGANLANMQAMAMGPDWARLQMSNKIAGEFASQGVGAEVPGVTSLTSDQIAQAVATAIANVQLNSQLSNSITAEINVNVAGGIASAADITTALQKPMEEIARNAFGSIVMEARSTAAEVRK